MKTIKLGTSTMEVSEIALGCMRMEKLQLREAEAVIRNAMEHGVNFFDHADIYGGGRSESVFAQAIDGNPSLRGQMVLQSKCGVRLDRFVRYDFSKEHILEAVNGSLKRLHTDYLDVLLLHRPDTLFEPDEVAEAFDTLYDSGKVRWFGVSNQSPMMMELLQKSIRQPIVANQIQFGIAHTPIIDRSVYFDTFFSQAADRDNEVLEYCRLKNITIQAWSPFLYGYFEGTFMNSEKYTGLNDALKRKADEMGVSPEAVATAWILRHPAKMQPVVGTMNVDHMNAICQASGVSLTRDEWYELYCAAGNKCI